MKKGLLFGILLCIVLVLFLTIASAQESSVVEKTVNFFKSLFGGNIQASPPGSPISDCQGLQNIGNNINGDYYLSGDINCQGFNFISISNFAGNLDGQGYTVRNLIINSNQNSGLFALIASGGSVSNLKLENANIQCASKRCGILAGINNGEIVNSSSSGVISGNFSGGLVGENSGIIKESLSKANVTCSGYCGGLVGNNLGSGEILNCYARGNVSGDIAGGLAGRDWAGIINNSYSTGKVEGDLKEGLVGLENGNAVCDWNLTFIDNFDGQSLDTSAWDIDSLRPNVKVVNGILNLYSKGTTQGHVFSNFLQKWGYFEASIRISNASGLNNAFWLMNLYPPASIPELDIPEAHYPNEIGSGIYADKVPESTTSLHMWNNYYPLVDLSEDFHIYSAFWNETTVIIYFDGKETYRIDTSIPSLNASTFNNATKIRFSTKAGYGGTVSPATYKSTMDVDWVRVYNQSDSPSNSLFCPSMPNSNCNNNFFDSVISGLYASPCGVGKQTDEMKNPSKYDNWNFSIWKADSSFNEGYPYLAWEKNTDNAPPIFTNLKNITLGLNAGLNDNIGAYDISGISCFTVDDTTNFNIDCLGHLTNKTALGIGEKYINIGVSDSLGNTASSRILITSTNDNIYPYFQNYFSGKNTLYPDEGDNTGRASEPNPSAFGVDVVNTVGTFDNVFLNININGEYETFPAVDGLGTLGSMRDYVVYLNLPGGVYSYYWSAIGSGNSHNINISEIRAHTVVPLVDTTPPVFANLNNQILNVGQSLNYNINASDASGISCFKVNDTVNFNINCSGFLKNITALTLGTVKLNISVNDTSNNKNSGIISISVQQGVKIAVSSCAQLQNIRDYPSGEYFLSKDIDCSGFNFNAFEFGGKLDGKGNSILNLNVNGADSGLFSINNGQIENLKLDARVNCTRYCGAIAGINNGLIINLSSQGLINGNITGGLAGLNNGIIRESKSLAKVNASLYAGGLVGENKGVIVNSYARGNVSGDIAGGLVGRDWAGIINNSYSTGLVLGEEIRGGFLGLENNNTSCNWNLTFVDNFDVDGLDLNKWNSQDGCASLTICRYPRNSHVENGYLKQITLYRDSAHIVTKDFQQKWGYFEARIRLANASNVNNAFWLENGLNSPNSADYTENAPEIDIIEAHSPNSLYPGIFYYYPDGWNATKGRIHRTAYPAQYPTFDCSQDFHTYAVLWNSTIINFMMDGKKYAAIALTPSFTGMDNLTDLRFSTVREGSCDGCGANDMDVDWVRVYNYSSNPVDSIYCPGISNSKCVNNYWDKETANVSTSECAFSSREVFEIKDINNYNSSWDFSNTWGIYPDINDGYPYLRWELTEDNEPPVFTNLANKTLPVGQSLNYDINASDASGISCFKVNDTINFNINCSGFLKNITVLSLGERHLNISVNDTKGNIASSVILINVTDKAICFDGDGDNWNETAACNYNGIADCNDTPGVGASIYPGAPEICSNDIDDNCNLQINEGCTINIPSLIAYYPFDIDGNDLSGNSNFGELKNGTRIDVGKVNNGINLDGVDDFVDVASSATLDIGGNLSIAAWVKINGLKAASKIVSRRSNNYYYFLGIDNDKPYAGIGDGSSTALTTRTFSMSINEWHHLAFVYNKDANTGDIYLDGVLRETNVMGVDLPKRSNIKLSIGADSQGTGYYFNGSIDEVRIYSKALNQEEINAILSTTCDNDNIIDMGETCDGNNVGIETCQSQGFSGGSLTCLSDCSGYDKSACTGYVDLVPPYFTNLANQTLALGESLNYDINASDNSGISCFKVNDTLNFAINCSGWLSNKTALSAGLYNLNITINDTSNNKNTSLMWVNVTPAIGNLVPADINGAIDGGRTGIISSTGTNVIQIQVSADPGNEKYWSMFNVTQHGKGNRTFIFDAYPNAVYSYYGMNALYSYDNGVTWIKADKTNPSSGYLYAHYYNFTQDFSQDSYLVSINYPMFYTEYQGYLHTLNSAYTHISDIGRSVEGRNITLLTITNFAIPAVNKKVIWLSAGQHPSETNGEYEVRGIIEFLTNATNQTAIDLRNRYVWNILPMLNPDGNYNGYSRYNKNGVNLNREWADDVASMPAEIKDAFLAVNNSYYTDGIDLFLDYHGNPTGNWIYTLGGSGVQKEWKDNEAYLISQIKANTIFTTSQVSSNIGTIPYSMWLRYNVTATTLETYMNNASKTPDYFKTIGVSTLGAIEAYFSGDSIYPSFSNYQDNNGSLVDSGIARFNVTIGSTNGTAVLNINGDNYIASNISNKFMVSVSLTSGVYSYYWKAYGNGSNHNLGQSSVRSYIVKEADLTPPQFTSLSDQLLNLGESLNYNILASDNSGISCFKVNDTTNFNINCAGLLTNKTALSLGIVKLNISVNDTYNNKNSGVISISVQQGITSILINQSVNFISIPITLANYSIKNITYGNEGKIIAIYGYNNGWKFYYPSHPELSNLQTLEPGKGYVVIANSQFSLALKDSGGVKPSINLNQGWNLVGIYSGKNVSSAFGEGTIVFEYNPASGYVPLGDSSALATKKAYWVYSNTARVVNEEEFGIVNMNTEENQSLEENISIGDITEEENISIGENSSGEINNSGNSS